MSGVDFNNVPSEPISRVDFASIPSNVAITAERADYLSNRSAEIATAFRGKLESLQKVVADARERYLHAADDMIQSASPEDRQTVRAIAKKNAARQASTVHRNLIANSQRDRDELLNILRRNAEETEAFQTVCRTPAMVLGRVALGDNKRTQYQMQLEGAGPIELETAARQAVMSGDLVLAAAVSTVVDRRPRQRRPFSVASFSERLLGPIWKDMNAKLEGVQLAYKTALAADREFVRGKADPLANISLALADKAIGEANGDDDSENA